MFIPIIFVALKTSGKRGFLKIDKRYKIDKSVVLLLLGLKKIINMEGLSVFTCPKITVNKIGCVFLEDFSLKVLETSLPLKLCTWIAF